VKGRYAGYARVSEILFSQRAEQYASGTSYFNAR
jgi:hypothetical protein